jgi:hypothetical protein
MAERPRYLGYHFAICWADREHIQIAQIDARVRLASAGSRYSHSCTETDTEAFQDK